MRTKKPVQKTLVPLDNDRRRGIYLTQVHGGLAYSLTPKQAKRVKKADNRAKLADALVGA